MGVFNVYYQFQVAGLFFFKFRKIKFGGIVKQEIKLVSLYMQSSVTAGFREVPLIFIYYPEKTLISVSLGTPENLSVFASFLVLCINKRSD